MKSKVGMIILLIVFGCNEVKSQSKSSDSIHVKTVILNTEKRCEKGRQQALKDYRNDDLGFYFYGNKSLRFNTYVRLMQKEYALKVKGGGGFFDAEGGCYNQIIREKIKLRFGEEAFENINKKLDSLYENDFGDRIVEYKGGEKELLKYIYCNISDDLLSTNKKETPTIIFKLSFNKDGKVINKGIIRKNKYAKVNDRYEIAARKIIDDMPDWSPAIENEESVAFDSYYIPIKFGKEIKSKVCN